MKYKDVEPSLLELRKKQKWRWAYHLSTILDLNERRKLQEARRMLQLIYSARSSTNFIKGG